MLDASGLRAATPRRTTGGRFSGHTTAPQPILAAVQYLLGDSAAHLQSAFRQLRPKGLSVANPPNSAQCKPRVISVVLRAVVGLRRESGGICEDVTSPCSARARTMSPKTLKHASDCRRG
jgi:hypothetical protein